MTANLDILTGTFFTNSAKDMTRRKDKIQSMTHSNDWPTWSISISCHSNQTSSQLSICTSHTQNTQITMPSSSTQYCFSTSDCQPASVVTASVIRYDLDGGVATWFHQKLPRCIQKVLTANLLILSGTFLTNTAKDVTRRKGKIQCMTDSNDGQLLKLLLLLLPLSATVGCCCCCCSRRRHRCCSDPCRWCCRSFRVLLLLLLLLLLLPCGWCCYDCCCRCCRCHRYCRCCCCRYRQCTGDRLW